MGQAHDPAEGRPVLGVLMLESRFPRPPGDIGNAATWPFAVRYRIVAGASPERVVLAQDPALLAPFVKAGRALVAEGARGIATSCGFLAPFQRPLAEALGVPVAASPLMMAPAIAATLPQGRRVGVLTIAPASLGPDVLAAAGVPADSPVGGVAREGALAGTILADRAVLDTAAAQAEMVAAARALLAAHPGIGALLLECTNMAPYAPAVAAATGMPVHSVIGFLHWFHAALLPPTFA
ncbi:MAG: aspartate/glutamate racemase family protein [Pseudomonadota bacterium]